MIKDEKGNRSTSRRFAKRVILVCLDLAAAWADSQDFCRDAHGMTDRERQEVFQQLNKLVFAIRQRHLNPKPKRRKRKCKSSN